jgi:hypothetical protein
MQSAFLSLALVIASMSATSPFPAIAQDSVRAAAQPESQALNVDFPGGAATEYITAIRKADADANIVVLGELDEIPVPAVRLRNVDVGAALAVLSELPPQQGNQGREVKIEEILRDGERSPVFTVTGRTWSMGKGTAHAQKTSVISMAELLGENLKPADALKAVETALELIKGDYEPAQIRFHEETGLLIARGSPEQIESIQQVIAQLQERAGTLRHKEQQAAQEAREESFALATAHGDLELQQARTSNDNLRQQVTAAETRAQLLEQEVAKLRDLVSRLEDEMRNVKADRDALAREAADNVDNKPKTDG